MGYVRGLVHGTIIGTVVGICIAPQTGAKTRDQLQSFGRAAREGYDVAERTVRQVAPFVSAGAHIAKEQVAKVRSQDPARDHDEDDTTPISVEGNVRVHTDGNGKR